MKKKKMEKEKEEEEAKKKKKTVKEEGEVKKKKEKKVYDLPGQKRDQPDEVSFGLLLLFCFVRFVANSLFF